jgi:hypothetical protein
MLVCAAERFGEGLVLQEEGEAEICVPRSWDRQEAMRALRQVQGDPKYYYLDWLIKNLQAVVVHDGDFWPAPQQMPAIACCPLPLPGLSCPQAACSTSAMISSCQSCTKADPACQGAAPPSSGVSLRFPASHKRHTQKRTGSVLISPFLHKQFLVFAVRIPSCP